MVDTQEEEALGVDYDTEGEKKETRQGTDGVVAVPVVYRGVVEGIG